MQQTHIYGFLAVFLYTFIIIYMKKKIKWHMQAKNLHASILHNNIDRKQIDVFQQGKEIHKTYRRQFSCEIILHNTSFFMIHFFYFISCAISLLFGFHMIETNTALVFVSLYFELYVFFLVFFLFPPKIRLKYEKKFGFIRISTCTTIIFFGVWS